MPQFTATALIPGTIYALAGLLAGLAVSYLANVLPEQRRIAQPTCPRCGSARPWSSAWNLWAPCASCGARRGLRPWLVVAVCIIGFVWVGLFPPARLGLWGGWFWLAYLLLVTVIDVEHHLILHSIAALGAAVAFVQGFLLHGLVPTIFGGLFGAAVMLIFYLLGIAYARWSARRHAQDIAEGEALGFGDVTFSGVMGLLLGWPGVVGGLVLAILLAGAAGLLALLPMLFRRQYDPNLALPYGPFLAAAIFYLLYLR